MIEVEEITTENKEDNVVDTSSISEVNSETVAPIDPAQVETKVNIERPRNFRLPLARVKTIMKMDPDCHLISQDACIIVTKATELFIEHLGQKAYTYTEKSKRKTLLKKDLDNVIESESNLFFLDGTMD